MSNNLNLNQLIALYDFIERDDISSPAAIAQFSHLSKLPQNVAKEVLMPHIRTDSLNGGKRRRQTIIRAEVKKRIDNFVAGGSGIMQTPPASVRASRSQSISSDTSTLSLSRKQLSTPTPSSPGSTNNNGVAQLRKRIEELTIQLEEVRQERDELSKKSESQARRITEIQGSLNGAERSLATTTRKWMGMSDNLRQVQTELESAKKECTSLNEKLAGALQDIARVTKEKEDTLLKLAAAYEEEMGRRVEEERVAYLAREAKAVEDVKKRLATEFAANQREAVCSAVESERMEAEERFERVKAEAVRIGVEEARRSILNSYASLAKAEKEAQFKRGSDATRTRLEAVHNLALSELRESHEESISSAVAAKEKEMNVEMERLAARLASKEKELETRTTNDAERRALEGCLAEAQSKVASLSADLAKYQAYIQKQRLKIKFKALRKSGPSPPKRPIGIRESASVPIYTAQIVLGKDYRAPTYKKTDSGRKVLDKPGLTEWTLPDRRPGSRKPAGFYRGMV